MTRSRPSPARKSPRSKTANSSSAISTPRRGVKATATPGTGGKDAGSVWDFDAPQFYDFDNSKTPGPSADKWFDYSHPTPTSKKVKGSRLSRLSFLSADSQEDLIPNRLSLSPSRFRAKKSNRLTSEKERDTSSASDLLDTANVVVRNVEFSDTDEEIEFNKWRRQHSLPERNGADITASKRHSESSRRVSSIPDGTGKAKTTVETSETECVNLANSQVSSKGDSIPKNTAKPALLPIKTAGSKVSKKTTTTIARKAEAAATSETAAVVVASKTLTMPIEQCGFMRPTKVATRRTSAKKRDKANQQMVAEMISRSVHRRLSQENTSALTIPKPFRFHGTDSVSDEPAKTSIDEFDAIAAEAAAIAEEKKRLTKKAQDHLLTKLASKRRASENSDNRVSGEPRKVTTPTKPAVRKAKPTVPKTPQFAKSKRVRKESLAASADSAPSNQSQGLEKKAARILAKIRSGSVNVPEKPAPLKPTVPQPFSFRSDAVAERHLQRLREEITKLKAEEEALRQFRANPLPDFPTPKKRKRQPPQPLHASPFQLETDVRGDAYQKQLRERLAELEERQRQRREFKAQPIPPSIDHPFVPGPSTLPLTEIQEILLKTELRSEERRAYDDDRTERERIREEVLARKRLEEERREEEEIKQLRKLLVHKAQPVRHYKPVEIHPSDRPLTVAKTPKWHVRTRQRPASPLAQDTPTKQPV
ncbi:hypothetical protein GGF39_002670 [Coemansia sp. RSA 1721]|nr:hypothetical protein GGF39_002670 [Coemansia sp. RSA 1721]